MEPSAASPTDQVQHIRLACQACQRKKIKCDRTFPCGQCTKSSLTCVPSLRKQRVRHAAGKRAVDGELRNRIAKLESLVESLSGESGLPLDKISNDTEHSTPTRTNPIDVESPAVGKYVASTFWSSLSNEVAALREVLEEDDGDMASPETDPQVSSPAQPEPFATLEHDLIVCPPGRIFIMPGVMDEPEPALRRYLVEVFFKNAEPVLKIFHRPTLRAVFDSNADYLGHPPLSKQHDAIKWLVYFAAINTLPEAEVQSFSGQSKIETLRKYRRFVGLLLSQLDLMNCSDLATLQCFAFFITVCRTTDSSRRTWTVLALLVRNAQAVYLCHEDPRASPYIKELRRRLWHYIRQLDKFCALDRGTAQLIRSGEYTIPCPTNTNDDLFGPSSTTIPELTDQITDMTFSCLCFEACDTIETLIMPENTPGGPTWEERRQYAVEMGERFEKKYLRLCDLSIPFQRLSHAIGKSICSAMILRAVRPMQRHVSSTPPPTDSPEVLRTAVDNLEASWNIYSDPSFEPWRWMRWVPWHPLAVTLAGLCSIRGTELADRAWALVEPNYKWCAQYVADSEDGMLWRPLTKIYKKAAAFRDAGLVDAKREAEKQPHSTSTATQSWPQAWADPSLDSSNGNSRMDHLSSGLRAMSPFDFNTVPTTGLDAVALLSEADLKTANLLPIVNDTSWTDWGQMVDDFNDPLAPYGGMDTDLLMNNWNFNTNMQL